jgi:uncharacterized membrane protein HdeD (DUF308 family)
VRDLSFDAFIGQPWWRGRKAWWRSVWCALLNNVIHIIWYIVVLYPYMYAYVLATIGVVLLLTIQYILHCLTCFSFPDGRGGEGLSGCCVILIFLV